MKGRKYASAQNSMNRRYGGKVLTNDSDWCNDCGGYLETKWSEGAFPMPYKEHICTETPTAVALEVNTPERNNAK